MNKLKIFLAAPISAFEDELHYKKSRIELLNLIKSLSENFQVYSEIINIQYLDSYDEPGKSVVKDFKEIIESDVFMLYHPMRMQTSTLIELGYAVAKEKKIIIISQPDILPYLALGLLKYDSDIRIVSSSELNMDVIAQIVSTIYELST